MTSEELARDLNRINRVLALMRACRYVDDDEDLEDEFWLQRRRQYILSLMAARRSQNGKKVVSLACGVR